MNSDPLRGFSQGNLPAPQAGGWGFERRHACFCNPLIPRGNLDFLGRHEKGNAGSLYHYCTKRISFFIETGPSNPPLAETHSAKFNGCFIGANPRELRRFIVVDVRLHPIAAKNEVVVDLAETQRRLALGVAE